MNTINNKLILLAFAAALLFISSCKEQPPTEGFTIAGMVMGLDNDDTYVKMSEYTFQDQDKADVLDSVKIIDGKFEFKGKVEFPDKVHLNIGDYFGSFFLENSDIKLIIDMNGLGERNPRFEPEVTGSASHSELTAADEKARAVFSLEKYKVLEEFNTRARPIYTSKDEKKIAELNKEREELMPLIEQRAKEYAEVKYDYVRQNPASTLAPHVLGVQYTESRMPRELLKEFYDIFEGDARKTGFFKNFITKIYKDNFENVGIGNTAPDFTLTTVDGNQLTLSEVDGKYILVDFWASWCAPCRASFPHLKDLRKKYKKDGFAIVGIGTADEKVKWEKAIEQDQTPWHHVFDNAPNAKGRSTYGPVSKSYGVPHLPTTLLVDNSNQEIILRNPKEEELDSKLAELFGH